MAFTPSTPIRRQVRNAECQRRARKHRKIFTRTTLAQLCCFLCCGLLIAIVVGAVVLLKTRPMASPRKTNRDTDVPHQLNRLLGDYYLKLGALNTFPLAQQGDTRFYDYPNRTLDYVDKVNPFEQVYAEYRERARRIFKGQVAGATSAADALLLRQVFANESIDDDWWSNEKPARCIEFDRYYDRRFLPMECDLFAESAPIHFVLQAPDFQQNYMLYPIYSDRTFFNYVGEMQEIANAYAHAVGNDYYGRLLRYGQKRSWPFPLRVKITIVSDLVALLDDVVNSSDFDGGSSALYTNVLFRGSQVDYFPPVQLDAAFRAAIEEIELQVANTLAYVLQALPDTELLDDTGVSGSRAIEAFRYRAYNTTMCSRGEARGTTVPDLDGFVTEMAATAVAYKQEAIDVLSATVPDFVGYSNLWMHIAIPQLANITNLGYSGTDCAPLGGQIDLEILESLRRGRNRRHEIGDLFGSRELRQVYLGNAFDGCDGSGNAFVNTNLGDFSHKSFGQMAIGPVVARGIDLYVTQHERVHVDQLSSLLGVCPDCYFRGLAPELNIMRNELLHALEGGATYTGNVVVRQDQTYGDENERIRGLWAAVSILLRLFDSVPKAAMDADRWTVDQTVDHWKEFAWFPLPPDAVLLQEAGNMRDATPTGDLVWYAGGWYRFLQQRRAIQTTCGNPPELGYPVRRTYDSHIALAGFPLDSIGAALDEFRANNCTDFLYI